MLKFLLSTSATVMCAVAASAFAPPAYAQASVTDAGAVQTYPKAYFDRFTPQTARDMIDRLPGFSLDSGEDLRGFGSGAGNVLVNGTRPSSKSGGVEEALERINADSVERIEVIRGPAGTSEAAGQAVVANVITYKNGRTARWEAQLERAAHGKFNSTGEITLARQLGVWRLAAQVRAYLARSPFGGTRISRDADSALTFFQLENSPSDTRGVVVSSVAERDLAGGALTLTGQFRRRPYSTETLRIGFDGRMPDTAPDQRLAIDFERTILDGEFGVDWVRPLRNDWSLKLLSLSSFEERDEQQLVFTERPIGVNISNSRFLRQRDTFETVFRTTASRSGDHRLKSEIGGEIAYNQLDSNLSLTVEELGAVSDIAAPAANVLVEELRGEAFANLIWQAKDKFTVETGVAAELSEISVSGDAANTQSFFFVKPFATLIYDPRPGVQLRLGVRRSIGQLDFSDFAASASAADDRVTAGNPELGPDQTTRASFSVDLRPDTIGAINVETFHEWRNNILEQSILLSGAQGVANAGSARVWGVKTNASLPLSPIIPGGLIEVEAEFLDSTFTDPITGERRAVSSIDSPSILAEFRQDLIAHQIAWGFSYRAQTDGPFFFVDEESYNRDGERWSVFVESTRFFGVKTNLEFSGIGKQNFFRDRRFFDPDRSGIFSGSQAISSEEGMFIRLTVSGQF